MKHKKSIFIFRQDLRLDDNTGLWRAIHESEEIIPIFIFDIDILKSFPDKNPVVGFIVAALEKLSQDLENVHSYLSVYYGKSVDIIEKLVTQEGIDAIYRNESYGYNAVSRDVSIQQFCKKQNIAWYAIHDYLLVPISIVPARKVFTPFFKLWQKYIIENQPTIHPAPLHIPSAYIKISHIQDIKKHLSYIPSTTWNTDFTNQRLDSFSFINYDTTRNIPSIDGSSKLSPYIRFGIISIRKLYKHVVQQNAQTYISELARREFWYHIFYNFPESRTLEFQEKRRHIQRDNNSSFFEARKNGMTGYPLIDAGMRQLKAENWIHNRVRMVVASFLTKDLLIDWRWGEKHFADYLIDYDTNVNIGNRQWSASVGADPKPLRIFSPMLQSERFDPECIYIKKRIPELQNISAKQIHNPLENDLGYATPIVNHYEWSKKAKEIYKESQNNSI